MSLTTGLYHILYNMNNFPGDKAFAVVGLRPAMFLMGFRFDVKYVCVVI